MKDVAQVGYNPALIYQFQGQSQGSSETQIAPTLIGGYDGHGSLTTLAIARALKVPSSNVIIIPPNPKEKQPGTSSEGLPSILATLPVQGGDIIIVDIPINIKDPESFINSIGRIAKYRRVTLIDHHETNMKYLSSLPPNVRLLQFSDTVAMAGAVEGMFGISPLDREMLMIGAVCDRDPAVQKYGMLIDQLYPLANTWDYLIRNNMLVHVKQVYERGTDYIKEMAKSVVYPPVSISQMARIERAGGSTIAIADIYQLPRDTVQGWQWKTFDYIAYANRLDYVVGIAESFDRQSKSYIPVLYVIKYFLSKLRAPRPLIEAKMMLGDREVVGHNDGFTVACRSYDDCLMLARNVAETLKYNISSVEQLVSGSVVAEDYHNIFDAVVSILKKISELTEKQNQIYEYIKSMKSNA